jgi:hypothetical protein
MIVREPNGEPKLMVILFMASLAQHRDAASGCELIPAVPGREMRALGSHPGLGAKPAGTGVAGQ